jgi:sporulation protein YlmC with PRC-barrel domain
MLNKIAYAAVIAAAVTGAAYAQQNPPASPAQTTTGLATPGVAQTLSALPPDASTVTNWYKQNVYDPSDNKIGEISDVLVDKDGKVDAFIVSVGGFLGIGEKDVAVPFNAIHATEKNGKWWLTMNATKDALKGAVGYKYDRSKATWVRA